eukprot:COSAG06_NODE_3272_length_5581_cov_19.995987_3_plen_82_part_00
MEIPDQWSDIVYDAALHGTGRGVRLRGPELRRAAARGLILVPKRLSRYLCLTFNGATIAPYYPQRRPTTRSHSDSGKTGKT